MRESRREDRASQKIMKLLRTFSTADVFLWPGWCFLVPYFPSLISLFSLPKPHVTHTYTTLCCVKIFTFKSKFSYLVIMKPESFFSPCHPIRWYKWINIEFGFHSIWCGECIFKSSVGINNNNASLATSRGAAAELVDTTLHVPLFKTMRLCFLKSGFI